MDPRKEYRDEEAIGRVRRVAGFELLDLIPFEPLQDGDSWLDEPPVIEVDELPMYKTNLINIEADKPVVLFDALKGKRE